VCLQEHYDPTFPDGRQASSNLRILEMAHMWRNQMKHKRDTTMRGRRVEGEPELLARRKQRSQPEETTEGEQDALEQE
jgi:hypothetical protein